MNDILGDKRIKLRTRATTPRGVLSAVEKRLTELQAEDPASARDEGRLLVEARRWLTNGPSVELVVASSSELTGVTGLKELVEAVADLQRPPREPVEDRIASTRTAKVTQASRDFTKKVSAPTGVVGTVSLGSIWASRTEFGAELSSVGSGVWAAGAAAAALLSLVVWMQASWYARRDRQVLKRLFDADIQSRALAIVLREQGHGRLRRVTYRRALLEATGSRSDAGYLRPFPMDLLHVTDLEGASDEATNLAIERFEHLGILRSVVFGTGQFFEYTGDLSDDEDAGAF